MSFNPVLTDDLEVDPHVPGGRGLEVDAAAVLVLVAGRDGMQHEAGLGRGEVEVGPPLQRVFVRPVLRSLYGAIATVDAAGEEKEELYEAGGRRVVVTLSGRAREVSEAGGELRIRKGVNYKPGEHEREKRGGRAECRRLVALESWGRARESGVGRGRCGVECRGRDQEGLK